MADYTATAHVFPSANDVRGSLAAGWGKTMYEANVGPYLANILSQGNYAFSGLVLPATSASLSITVGAGTAMIYGHYVAVDATAVTVGASVTSYCYLKLTLDANNNVSAVKYETNTTGTQPSYSILVGKIVSGVGTITSTVQDGMPFGVSHPTKGPVRIGTGSTRSLETFVSATGNLSGVHYYNGDVTLDSGHTLTIPSGSGRLVIITNGRITINGTITGAGGGLLGGGAGGTGGGNGTAGNPGTAQPGGGGGSGSGGSVGGAGGAVTYQGLTFQSGGAGGTGGGGGSAGSQLTGSSILHDAMQCWGGASGGGGGANTGDNGGAGALGGASIILIAPTIVLAATATLNTTGSTGSAGTATGGAGGGGGGAGNVYIITRSFTDDGATFTQTGGSGGSGHSGAGSGGAGAAGVKQINIY